jgi:uncharacterized lipoprotein NlpE involved in copper resistance
MKPRLAAVALAASVLLLAGCANGAPEETPSETASSTTESTASAAPTPDGAPDPTTPEGGFALPASCEQVWSPGGLSVLTEELGALNDPGFTMSSTEVVDALEVLDAAETLRCTWGVPSEVGIATNVTIVDDAQAQTVRDALDEEGFSCEDRGTVTRCDLEEEIPGGEAGPGALIVETHVLGAGGWASTHALNIDLEPDYTDDLIATVWG